MAKDCAKINRLYQDYEKLQALKAKDDDNAEGLEYMRAIASAIGLEDEIKQVVYSKVVKKVITNVTGKRFANKAIGLAFGPIGAAVGIAADVLESTDTSCGAYQYYDNLKMLLHEYHSGGKQHVPEYFARLVDAQKTIEIEKDFGSNSYCYKTIDNITKAVKAKYVDKNSKLKQG